MEPVRVARNAMATRFEIALHGENPVALRAAAEEALEEIEGLESRLSLFRASSDISRVNARAAFEPVRVQSQVFELLKRAQLWHRETSGAFDITIAPLMRCWGFLGGSGKMPDPQAIEEARRLVGMDKVVLDENEFTVRFTQPGMMLDLGGVGKGYALECAVEVLIEAGVTSALLHGGTSTIQALGAPPGDTGWKVAIESPPSGDPMKPVPQLQEAASEDAYGPLIAVVALRDEAMSVSGVHGKSFTDGGTTYGHVIDPRIGRHVDGALLSAVVLKSATDTDALSTALLTLGLTGCGDLVGKLEEMRYLLAGARLPSGESPMLRRGI